MLSLLLAAVLGQVAGAQPETLGAEELVTCRVRKILSGVNAGQFKVIEVVASNKMESPKPDTKPADEKGEKVGNETLGPVKTVNLTGYGECEAREIMAGPADVGKWRIVRQLGDSYGFTTWLNGVRAQSGLSPVAYDSNLSAWAAQNNNAQMAMGMGHHVMGAARRQNAAMMVSFPGPAWMGSGGHRDALLDPSITRAGIDYRGGYWTFSAN
jgi:hypothetical protein